MKLSVEFYVVFTTLFLLTLVVFGAMDFPIHWTFLLTVIGQFLVLLMVYRVLTDAYTTDKTFEDYYEDHPIGRETH